MFRVQLPPDCDRLRLRMARVSRDDLMTVLTGWYLNNYVARVKEGNEIPPGCVVLDVRDAPFTGGLDLLLWHPSFSPVNEGEVPPRINERVMFEMVQMRLEKGTPSPSGPTYDTLVACIDAVPETVRASLEKTMVGVDPADPGAERTVKAVWEKTVKPPEGDDKLSIEYRRAGPPKELNTPADVRMMFVFDEADVKVNDLDKRVAEAMARKQAKDRHDLVNNTVGKACQQMVAAAKEAGKTLAAKIEEMTLQMIQLAPGAANALLSGGGVAASPGWEKFMDDSPTVARREAVLNPAGGPKFAEATVEEVLALRDALPKRTPAQVQAARRTPTGCCYNWNVYKPCNCMEEAEGHVT